MKSKKDFLMKAQSFRPVGEFIECETVYIEKAMQEYADQQIEAYKAKLKKVNGLESLTTVKQPSPESQDDLWNSLMEQWHDVSLNMQEPHILPYLKSKFTITRKL